LLKSSAGEPKMQLIYDLEEAKSYLNRRQPRLPEVSGRLKRGGGADNPGGEGEG